MPRDAVTIATCQPVAPPNHYLWWFPGSPVKVHLELSVAQRLKDRVEHSPAAVQEGLLFGRALNGTTEILEFEPLANVSAPDSLAALPEARKQSLVGYYRTEPGESLRLNANDLFLADAFFAQPHQVFLLIQSGGFGAPNATFFFRKSDGSMADFPFLEFALDPALLAMEERDRLNRSRAAVSVQHPPLALPEPAPASIVGPVAPSSAPPSNTPSRFILKAAGCVLIGALLGAAGIALRVRRTAADPAPLPAASPLPGGSNAEIPSAPPTPTLGLVAQRHTGDVQLTWSRESSAIAAATSGVISIEDGGSHREIPLGAWQVHNGSLLYSPSSDQVLMQLTVATPTGPVSESVMVVLPSKARKTSPALPSGSPPEEPPPAPVLLAKATKPFSGIPVVTGSAATPTPALSDPPVETGIPTQNPSIPALALQRFQEPPPQAPTQKSPTPQVQTAPAQKAPVPVQKPPVRVQTAPAPTTPTTAVLSTPQPRPAITQTYIPPKPISKPQPRFPIVLKTQLKTPSVVEVQVTIDEAGKVTRAVAVSRKDVADYFVEATLKVARLWRFEPARKNYQPVSSEMTLKFVFND